MTFFIEKNTISAVFQNSISGYNTCFAGWFGIEYVITELNMLRSFFMSSRKRLKGIGFFDNHTSVMVGWSKTLGEPPRGCFGSQFYWLTEAQVRLLSFDEAKHVELIFEYAYQNLLRSRNESNN